MQRDMHYFGTYAMARAAGINPDAARVIATAAEYVDDSDDVSNELIDGSYVHAEPTAHHPVNGANLKLIDQRRVWVPFHFIPGNTGDTFEERLICTMDGPLAREMVNYHLEQSSTCPCPLEQMGVIAHVYADTFSHYGFSGITSDLNRVDGNSIQLTVQEPSIKQYIQEKAAAFANKYIAGAVANVVGLGHGAVATYPDRPYLTWQFRYEATGKESGLRENQKTFLLGCRKIYEMFLKFGDALPDVIDKASIRKFESIEKAIINILAVEGDLDTRALAWVSAAKSGAIIGNSSGEEIPDYDASLFANDIQIMSSHTAETVTGTSGFGFLRAAQRHRSYMLETLLPKHNLPVLMSL